MKIQQHHTAFSRDEQIVLGNSDIKRIRGGKIMESIRIEDITSIRVLCDGHSLPHKKTVYRCVVKSASSTIKFSNAIYGGKENQQMDRSYTRMLVGLHSRVATESKNAKFVQGSNFYYLSAWFCLIAGIIAVCLVPVVLFASGSAGHGSHRLWSFAMIPLMITGFAIPLIKRGRSKEYTANTIPAGFLPK